MTVFLERFVEIVTPDWSNFLSLRTRARGLEPHKKAQLGTREGRRWKKVLLPQKTERQSGAKLANANPAQRARDKTSKWGFPWSTRKYHLSLTVRLESCRNQFGHLRRNQAKECKFWLILAFAIVRFVNKSCKINARWFKRSDFVLHRWI